MLNTPYDDFTPMLYQQFVGDAVLSNARLRNYFDACFQQAIDDAGCYPAWACIGCLSDGQATNAFGERPSKCPKCESRKCFQIATFQSRAPLVGRAFERAVLHLLRMRFELPAEPTPGNTRTHDIEVTHRIAIESKGSPRSVQNPDGSIIKLGRPGLERSDTWKKAQSNAHTFRERNRGAPFYIVSNAVPHDLVGYRSDDITGIFNLTHADRMQAFVREINLELSA